VCFKRLHGHNLVCTNLVSFHPPALEITMLYFKICSFRKGICKNATVMPFEAK